jgi:phosphate transport system permease protein
MAEYASKRVRSFAKPLIEILAGIPTIVYGLFALITVGPLLRDYFAEPLGSERGSSSSGDDRRDRHGHHADPLRVVAVGRHHQRGAASDARRLLRAGRDASPRRSSRWILPAALPGIVGAILLAASRAIGETMIVVLGAGAAARLSLNPFEAMTTVTAKIVGQLTGDTDFRLPEALVAFALGLTLFVITLGLNVLALYIVRKYREQYE